MKKNNIKRKALLLSSIASLCILCGCSTEKNTVIINGETYIQNGEEYTKLDLSPKVFEPGEHIIHYTYTYDRGINRIGGETGWGTSDLNLPETPEGYRYVETITLDEAGYGHTSSLVHIFVNVERVEVQAQYDSKNNTIVYPEPGKVIEEMILTN